MHLCTRLFFFSNTRRGCTCCVHSRQGNARRNKKNQTPLDTILKDSANRYKSAHFWKVKKGYVERTTRKTSTLCRIQSKEKKEKKKVDCIRCKLAPYWRGKLVNDEGKEGKERRGWRVCVVWSFLGNHASESNSRIRSLSFLPPICLCSCCALA